MKGYVLNYSVPTSSGVISGDDGVRYSFTSGDWKHNDDPSNGAYVDFEVSEEGHAAKDIFLAPPELRRAAGAAQLSGEKSKVAAGLLGIFLGSLGIHKFYLGYSRPGLIMLLVSVIGFVLFFPALIMGIIGIIEGIVYLTMSDEQFEETYVRGIKHWF